MKKCYIVGAGDVYGFPTPCEEDLVIAADGGLDHLLSRGIVPDVIVGDFDSVEKNSSVEPDTELGFVSSCDRDGVLYQRGERRIGKKTVEVIKYPVKKDETDTYLAYLAGASRGCTEFEIYGGVGGREDHTFANFCLLLRIKNEKNNAVLYGNGVKFFVLKNEKTKVFGNEGKTVSVFSFLGSADGVSIRGLKYEASSVRLECARPLGVSNSFTASGEGEIEVESGALLVAIYF